MELYIVIKNMNNYIDYEILKPKEGSKIIAYFYGDEFQISTIMTYFRSDILNSYLYKYRYYKNE